MCLIVQRHIYVGWVSVLLYWWYTRPHDTCTTLIGLWAIPQGVHTILYSILVWPQLLNFDYQAFHATLVCTHAIRQRWWNESIYKWLASVPMKQTVCMLHIQQGASLNTTLLCQWLTMWSLLVLSLAIFLSVDAIHGQEQDHLSRIQARQLNDGDLNCMSHI